MASTITISPQEAGIEEIELQLLLDALARVGGYDYRAYDPATLKRRVSDRMRSEGVETISALQNCVLHDQEARTRFVLAMSEGRRELFQDHEFFLAFRANVVPLLQTYSFVRIWFPGSGTGEDPYAIAALLEDIGMLDRCVIYATSFSDLSVEFARAGEYEITNAGAFKAAIRRAGLTCGIERVAEVENQTIRFSERIRNAVMVARHDPTASASINEFHTIIARGLFPLFNGAARYRLHQSVFESLTRLGFLCLGANETLQGTVHERAYRRVTPEQSIYRRLR